MKTKDIINTGVIQMMRSKFEETARGIWDIVYQKCNDNARDHSGRALSGGMACEPD